MDGLRTFYENLGSADRDMFVQLISESSMNTAPAIKDQIEKRLEEVVNEINKINRKREVLGRKADMFSDFAEQLQLFMNKNKGYALEIVLIKKFFSLSEDRLRREIAELKPDRLLEEKYELKIKLREMRDDISSFAKINHVLHLIIKKKEQNGGRKQAITVQ